MVPQKKRLVVIGGGAAGFFCAVNAARLSPNLEVIILEKSNKVLAKVRVSGGGRCNVTHACFDIADMSKNYPRGAQFVKKAFHLFFTSDTITWFADRGLPLKTERDGRMFPVTDSSQTVIDCLMNEANKYNVAIRLHCTVIRIVTAPANASSDSDKINPAKSERRFTLTIAAGNAEKPREEMLEADYVCVACGGYPKNEMFDWLKATGHAVEPPLPSLFTFNLPKNPITELMGIAVENAKVKIAGSKLENTGPLLITHWGLSGPAVLKLSALGARELAAGGYHFQAIVNWLPAYNESTLREQLSVFRVSLAPQKMGNKSPLQLPMRLWEFLLQASGIKPETRWADLPAAAQHQLVKNCCSFVFEVKGKTTFKEEFVTAGGIALAGIDPQSMMSKLQPGLYFAGEVMDVDGVTGGFNFQHAWTSGWVAARAISRGG